MMMDGEVAGTPNAVKAEYAPTEEEVKERMAAHVPFRPWCPVCV